MPQQHNPKYIFLLYRSFSDRELLNEVGEAENIAFNGQIRDR